MQNDVEKRLAALEKELAKARRFTIQDAPKAERPTPAWTRSTKFTWIAVILSATLLVVTVPIYIKLHHQQTSSKSQTSNLQQIAKSAGFEVYFPGQLPQGFSFDPKNASLSSGILIYTIAGPNNSTITVTEQKKPQNFDYHSIQTDTSFKTPYGVATSYEQSDKSMGSLVSDNTWVVLNTSKAIGAKAMEAVLQSLQSAK